ELVLEGAVEVALGEGLGGAGVDRDVPAAELDRPVEPALGGNEHREVAGAITQPLVGDEGGEQVGGAGQLRHPLRVDEAGRLDDRQPGGDQALHERRLGRGRHDRGLVLQAVARADLPDRHLGRADAGRRMRGRTIDDPGHAPLPSLAPSIPAVGSTSIRTVPSATCSPTAAPTATTVPANGAVSARSIFIASIAPSRWPAETVSPTATSRSSTVPGIGAVMDPAPGSARATVNGSGRVIAMRWPASTTSTAS